MFHSSGSHGAIEYMSSTTESSTEGVAPSFLKQWGVLIAFGILAVAALITFKSWTESNSDAPVAAEYAAFLDYLASESANARQYREAYYQKFSRRTVASQHYEHVCGVMHRASIADGVDPAKFSEHMSQGCESFAEIHSGNELPK